jgi:2',3'-cyclic-nucleotide 2'-phosphodiesterase (5'-nucleotidase family)
MIGDDCRQRPDICLPLNPAGSYRVAVNDYIANGGSGFIVLKRNTTKFNTGISLRDALVDFIQALPSRCTDPAVVRDYGNIACISPEVQPHDGRIRPVIE